MPPVALIEVINPPGPSGWPEADKLFEKYYRSPHARRQAGTGLGLFLARQLARVMGGNVEYEPQDGCIRFVVRIPLEAIQAKPDRPESDLG
jgi:signal transduction histidine kinase